jgi:hypothetical protein
MPPGITRVAVPVLAFAVALTGCATAPAAQAPAPSAAPSPLGSPFADERYRGGGAPLIIDRGDLALGTTVTFERLPTANEMYDVQQVHGLAHVVIALPAWPNEYAALEALKLAPAGIDVAVILPGYPPSRGTAEVWNLLGAPVRIIILAQGPPPDPGVIADLNTMRNLERVIAEMDEPSRAGFERLQRPLSFRKVVR